MNLPAEVVDELFLLAHAPTPWRAMGAVLAPHVGGDERGSRLACVWMPEPLRPGGPLPSLLPEGSEVPPSRTPWPRSASPVPGVDLDPEAVIAAALEVVAARAGIDMARRTGVERGQERIVAERAALRLLTGVVPAGRLPAQTLMELARRWDPLPCIRHAHPPRLPPGWLPADELEEALRGLEAGTFDGKLAAWRLMVLRGAEPAAVATAIRTWKSGSEAMPSGQWCAISPATGPGPDEAAARRRIDAAIAALLAEQPLHWALLARATLVASATVPTMAVGVTVEDRIALFFSPTFVCELSREELVGVLLHEIHHVIFGHVGHDAQPQAPSERMTSEQYDRRQLAWTLACEATANEPIRHALPGEPVTIESLALPPGESTPVRFQRLLRMRKKTLRIPVCLVVPHTLTARPRSTTDIVARPVNPGAVIRRAVADIGGVLPPELEEALRRELGGARVEAWLARGEREPALSWQRLLRDRGAALRERHVTRRWPSRRRAGDLGVVPGRRSRRGRPAILVAIDTSASLSAEDLAAIRAELDGLRRPGARVAVLQCDTAVRQHGWLGDPGVLDRLVGRGGTDLRPPFEDRWRKLYKPELIVFFTDGHGPSPGQAPHGCDVLWILTGSDARQPASWGRVVWMR